MYFLFKMGMFYYGVTWKFPPLAGYLNVGCNQTFRNALATGKTANSTRNPWSLGESILFNIFTSLIHLSKKVSTPFVSRKQPHPPKKNKTSPGFFTAPCSVSSHFLSCHSSSLWCSSSLVLLSACGSWYWQQPPKSDDGKKNNMTGWWLNQPIWKILVKMGIFPK